MMNEVQLLLDDKVMDFEAPGVPIKIDNWAPCTNAEDRAKKGVVEVVEDVDGVLGDGDPSLTIKGQHREYSRLPDLKCDVYPSNTVSSSVLNNCPYFKYC